MNEKLSKELILLDVENLTSEERRRYIKVLSRYKEYFEKSIIYYKNKRHSKEQREKSVERMSNYRDVLLDIFTKCKPKDNPNTEEVTVGEAINSLSGVVATNTTLQNLGGGALVTGGIGMLAGGAVLGLPGAIGVGAAVSTVTGIKGLITRQTNAAISEKELNEHLLMMLQTTITMLTKLNVSEDMIVQALLTTLNSVTEIKNKYGDDLEEEQLAKLVQDECAEKILNSIAVDNTYLKLQRDVTNSIGNSAWSKMSEVAQTFIVDAEVLYEQIKSFSDFDYSAICLTASKALEVEITRRYFSGYLEYLKKSRIKDMPKGVINQNYEELKVEEFMLGTISKVTGYAINEDGRIILLGKYKDDHKLFLEYAQKELIICRTELECKEIIQKHVKIVNRVRKKYRNPSAHKAKMSFDSAKECLEYLVDVQRALGDILDDCKW